MFQAKIFKAGIWVVGILILGFLVSQAAAFWGLAAIMIFAIGVYFFPGNAFYFLIAYLPFQIALNPTAGIDLMSGRVFILILFFVWVASAWQKREKISWIKTRNSLALVLFFFVALISLLVSGEAVWGVRKIFVFASIFPLFWLATGFVDNQIKTKKVFWIVSVSSGLSALIALTQFLSQFVFGKEKLFIFWSKFIAPLFFGHSFGEAVIQNPSWLTNVGGRILMRAIGLFPDPHMLAFFLGMSAPLVLALAWSEKKYRLILSAIFFFNLAALLLTFSRGGYLGLMASLAVFGVSGWSCFGKKIRLFASGFLLSLVVLFLILDTPISARLYSSFDLTEGSNAGRLAIWSNSLAYFKENPFLGVGLGNYPLALNFNESYRSAVTSHNLYLDILVETGIFGFLAWAWFFWGLLAGLGAKIKKAGNFNPLVLGLFASLAYFCVHSFFETAIFNPTILALLMLLAGLAGGLAEEKK